MEHNYVSDGLCDDRLLAQPPTTPTRSFPSFSLPRRAREPVAASTPIQLPKQSQQRALLSLARFDPWKVIAWIDILQSLESGYQHNGGPAPLTPEELSAVSELKGCGEDWLLAWLTVAAQPRQ